MKLHEAIAGYLDSNLVAPPKIREIDKNGRLYIGVDHAKKKALVLLVEVESD